MPSELVTKVFAAVDATDAAAFSRFFADNGRMVFGNGAPMIGPEAIEAGVVRFFETIKGLRHTVVNEWVLGSDTICELSVAYDRLDGTTVTVPAVGIWHLDEQDKVEDYRVYVDLAPVFA